MKITKSKLKEIIKESMQDEYKEKLSMLFKAGNHQQAIELSKQVDVDFLVGADLALSRLIGADLRGANLSKANISWSNLSGANLSGANLSGADLRGTVLKGADLTDVKYDQLTIWPQGFEP